MKLLKRQWNAISSDNSTFSKPLAELLFYFHKKIVAISSNRQDRAIKLDLEILNWQLAYHCELLVKSTRKYIETKSYFCDNDLGFCIGISVAQTTK